MGAPQRAKGAEHQARGALFLMGASSLPSRQGAPQGDQQPPVCSWGFSWVPMRLEPRAALPLWFCHILSSRGCASHRKTWRGGCC